MTRRGYVCLFAAAVCSYPQTYNDYMRQGAEAFNRGELVYSVRAYEDAVRANPSDVLGKLHLAFVLLRQEEATGGWERARRLSAEVLQMAPANNQAEWNLALLDMEGRNPAGAKGHCAAILARQPQHSGCLFTAAESAWASAFPEVMAARQHAGMRVEAAGPLPDPVVRKRLVQRFEAELDAGLEKLGRLREMEPNHGDAAAYQNLIQRMRATLAASDGEAKALIADADRCVKQAMVLRRVSPASDVRLDPVQLPPMAALPKRMAPYQPPPPPPPGR